MAAFVFTILPGIPLAVWFLLVGWSANTIEGEVLLRVPVTLLARLKMLWLPIAVSFAALVIALAIGDSPWWIGILYPIIWLSIVSIPIHYTLTTMGIRTGRGVFRRWTEFAGVRRSRNGAVLQGGQRASSYPIFLSGGRDDDEFVLTLKHLVQDSYKGRATVRDRLRETAQSVDETGKTSSINH